MPRWSWVVLFIVAVYAGIMLWVPATPKPVPPPSVSVGTYWPAAPGVMQVKAWTTGKRHGRPYECEVTPDPQGTLVDAYYVINGRRDFLHAGRSVRTCTWTVPSGARGNIQTWTEPFPTMTLSAYSRPTPVVRQQARGRRLTHIRPVLRWDRRYVHYRWAWCFETQNRTGHRVLIYDAGGIKGWLPPRWFETYCTDGGASKSRYPARNYHQ